MFSSEPKDFQVQVLCETQMHVKPWKLMINKYQEKFFTAHTDDFFQKYFLQRNA